MGRDEINVTVVKYPDRKFLMMRFVDPYTGKQIARSTRTTKRRDAERIAAKWEAELREGRYQPDCKLTWEAFRERYEGEVLPSLAENTGNLIGTTFNAIERILRPKKLRDLNSDRISFFQAQLRNDGLAEESIRAYLAHLRSALTWAVAVELLSTLPKIQRPKRLKKSKLMKGRPIATEEFERMLDKVAAVMPDISVPSYKYLMTGLWWSGLRLSEALVLHWNRPDRLRVDLSGRRPMFVIPGELEKGNKDRLCPMAPEFAEFLSKTPDGERSGAIFPLVNRYGRRQCCGMDWVSRKIAKFGKAANVKVHVCPKTGKVKFASAHDLRRSFGERWARKVMPQVLKELMRHESIETTMKYYVGHNAQLTADVLWQAYEQEPKVDVPSKDSAPRSSQQS